MRRTVPLWLLGPGFVLAFGLACGSDPSSPGGGGIGGESSDGGEGGQGGESPVLDGVDFTVRSTRATRIEVHVFTEGFGVEATLVRPLERQAGSDTWTARVTMEDLEDAGLGTDVVHYGYRAWGPNWPFDEAWTPGSEIGFVSDVDADGNRFNPNKLLVDPSARELSHDPRNPLHQDTSVYRTGPEHRAKDSGPFAPKSLWFAASPANPIGERPLRALRDDVIYETHVRGLTMQDPTVSEACRGTYAGAAEKAEYLADLGVTAIEFLPVQETPNEANDLAEGTDGDNYWGYSTLAFFAPDRRYACDRSPGGPTREFTEMVRAFHDQGIKVFIDVVYNHTSEGGVGDPNVTTLYSLRGLDNPGYYLLSDDNQRYADYTGVGASTNAASPLMRDLAIESLVYWHEELGVDGFRFDLASVLGNACEKGCFDYDRDDPEGILMRATTELPARAAGGGEGVDLIAEPWGVGNGTYQIGNFPEGWAEWNGQYRDTFRRDMNLVDVVDVPPRELVERIQGSPGLFQDDGRRPWNSIDFFVSHDGFTLRDLHSCDAKDNDQPWPYGPSDGGENNNLSWNYNGDPSRQRQATRTALALMMLSAGVPMITGGDELFRTQYCNNNAYNLDSDKNWIEWGFLEEHAQYAYFAREMIRFRRAHPALRPDHWPSESSWTFLRDDGQPADAAYLDDVGNHFIAWRVDTEGAGDEARSIYVAYNGATTEVSATLPVPAEGYALFHVLDTAAWLEAEGNIREPGMEPVYEGSVYGVKARAVLVMIERAVVR